MRTALLTILCSIPLSVQAAGGGDTAPKPTQTTEVCAEGLIWDLATETCLPPEESTNEDSAMMDSVRELAHFGRLADAKAILDRMPDQSDDLVLTYQGFVTRKMGDVPAGMAYYAQALALNPDNLLARSYKGQAHVEAGNDILALVELVQIRQRGGAGSWAETSLADAVSSGRTYTY